MNYKQIIETWYVILNLQPFHFKFRVHKEDGNDWSKWKSNSIWGKHTLIYSWLKNKNIPNKFRYKRHELRFFDYKSKLITSVCLKHSDIFTSSSIYNHLTFNILKFINSFCWIRDCLLNRNPNYNG